MKDWVLKETHILNTIYTSVMPLFLSNKKIWRWLIGATSTTTIMTMKETTPWIGWKNKTKQNKSTSIFEKTYVINFTMCNRVGHSTPMAGAIHSFLHHTLFSPNSVLWHSMLVVATVGYRVRTSVWVDTRLETWPIYRSGQATLGWLLALVSMRESKPTWYDVHNTSQSSTSIYILVWTPCLMHRCVCVFDGTYYKITTTNYISKTSLYTTFTWCHPWMDDGTDGWVTWCHPWMDGKSFMTTPRRPLLYVIYKYHLPFVMHGRDFNLIYIGIVICIPISSILNIPQYLYHFSINYFILFEILKFYFLFVPQF